MKGIVNLSLVILALVSLIESALAKDALSFNGQQIDRTSHIVKAKDYGKYQPSEFSSNKEIVLVSWNSEEGKKRFFRSRFNNDFFQIAHHYQPQANPLYCGIASSVIILNSIRAASGKIPNQPQFSVKKPQALGGDVIPYNLYSQSSLLNENTDKVKLRKIIQLKNISLDEKDNVDQFDPGLKLKELKAVLESYQLEVQQFPAQEKIKSGVEKFRRQLKTVLSEDKQFMLINYKSNMVGQLGGGHISPLGAYDAESDSVLVLDVAGYQNPWIWIPLHDLYASMHTKDGEFYRGYLVAQEGLK